MLNIARVGLEAGGRASCWSNDGPATANLDAHVDPALAIHDGSGYVAEAVSVTIFGNGLPPCRPPPALYRRSLRNGAV